jgi:hypothetical protein
MVALVNNSVDTPIEFLLSTPPDLRDLIWENQFFEKVFSSPLLILSEEPVNGPDGWPYMIVQTTREEGEDPRRVLAWLQKRGVGVAINPAEFGNAGAPELVVNWGGVWHYCETKILHHVLAPNGSGDFLKENVIELTDKQTFFIGNPTQSFLPPYVRNILREFFAQQGQKQVRLCVISKDQMHYDLAFALESLGNPPKAEHEGVLEAVSWFLPSHYSITILPERNLRRFYDL